MDNAQAMIRDSNYQAMYIEQGDGWEFDSRGGDRRG